MTEHSELSSARVAASARAWPIAMTQRSSVTGSTGEASFGPWLAERLSTRLKAPAIAVWTFNVPPDGQRHCVAMLVRGRGRETGLLTGHYDIVAVSDYGDLAGIATEPEALAAALMLRLDRTARTPAELRAKADLAFGAFLLGRGLLDMKAGLATGIAVAERFATDGGQGNILFLAVPDEERSLEGARRAAPELHAIARTHKLDMIGAVNLDAIADDGDGSAVRSVALGSIEKLLTTAFVVGVPTHAGLTQAGLNAAVLAAAIVSRAEWAVELTDHSCDPATPPSLLMLSDGRTGYDVTTPATTLLPSTSTSCTRRPRMSSKRSTPSAAKPSTGCSQLYGSVRPVSDRARPLLGRCTRYPSCGFRRWPTTFVRTTPGDLSSPRDTGVEAEASPDRVVVSAARCRSAARGLSGRSPAR